MSIVDVFSDLVIGLATFIFWRMFTGAPAEHETVPAGPGPGPASVEAAPAGPARSLPVLLEDICMATGLEGVEQFLARVGWLYEALLPAFATGDIAALRCYLADDVYDTFQSAIAERNLRGETVDLMFIGIDAASIASASLTERRGQIAVHFRGLVVSVTRDAEGRELAGDASLVVGTASTWTFEYDRQAPHADWMLVGTEPDE